MNDTKIYDEGVDYKFLEAMGVMVVKHQPWQLGLYKEELQGKFVWYPKKGTLMYQHEDAFGNMTGGIVGYSGDFLGIEKESTENVYNEIMKKINKQ